MYLPVLSLLLFVMPSLINTHYIYILLFIYTPHTLYTSILLSDTLWPLSETSFLFRVSALADVAGTGAGLVCHSTLNGIFSYTDPIFLAVSACWCVLYSITISPPVRLVMPFISPYLYYIYDRVYTYIHHIYSIYTYRSRCIIYE